MALLPSGTKSERRIARSFLSLEAEGWQERDHLLEREVAESRRLSQGLTLLQDGVARALDLPKDTLQRAKLRRGIRDACNGYALQISREGR